MKSILLGLCCLLALASFGQDYFLSLPMDALLKRARAEHRMIFMQVECSTCSDCNELADKSFADKDLSEKLEQTFLCIKIAPRHPDRAHIMDQYNLGSCFGSLFLDEEGTLIRKFTGAIGSPATYLKEVNLALIDAGESLRISELEKEFNAGNRNLDFLELFLTKKRTLGLETDSLLNTYVRLLPLDSLNSERTLQFIAGLSPLIGSTAYTAMYRNTALFNSAWFKMSAPYRSLINRAIMAKSMKKAVQEKDEQYAFRIASFARGTTSRERPAWERYRNYDAALLSYYQKAGDTSKYLINAVYFYDRYLSDTVAQEPPGTRLPAIGNFNLVKIQAPVYRGKLPAGSQESSIQKPIPPAAARLISVNNLAWTIYLFTNRPYYLALATQWIQKGLQSYQTPAALDTYARLLYKQKQVDKALEIQSKAIALKQKEGLSAKDYKEVLEKMKSKVEKLD